MTNEVKCSGCATPNTDDPMLWIGLKTSDEMLGFSLAEVIEAGLRQKIVGLAEADRDAAIADCVADILHHLRADVAEIQELTGKLQAATEPLCRLPASGFTETPGQVLAWADQVVTSAKRKLNGFEPTMRVWAYRHNGAEYLAADISDEHESSVGHSLTFVIGEDLEVSLNLEEPAVPDMADALHLVGIVAEGLKAGIRIGRRGNEVNAAVLARPLGAGETNGTMRVAG